MCLYVKQEKGSVSRTISTYAKERRMLKDKMLKALNEQINAEMYSSYLYLSMESYFQSISLTGFAAWMRGQVQEELFSWDKDV